MSEVCAVEHVLLDMTEQRIVKNVRTYSYKVRVPLQ